jgi:hypothetical protein
MCCAKAEAGVTMKKHEVEKQRYWPRTMHRPPKTVKVLTTKLLSESVIAISCTAVPSAQLK